MKNQLINKMPRTRANKKDADNEGDKAPGRKQPARFPSKKKAGAHDDDDESIDSHGNIRGLIAYTSEDEDSEEDAESVESTLTPEQRSEIRRASRKAGLKARQRISDAAKSRHQSAKKREESEEESEEEPKKRSKGFMPRKKSKKIESEEDEESEEEIPKRKKGKKVESESESEEDEEEDDDYDEEDEYEEEFEPTGISINIGSFGEESAAERMKPKRHNMKKESESVKKFLKLVTAPIEDNTIDDQIDQFKSLSEEKQNQLLAALDRKTVGKAAEENLMFRILTMKLPIDTQTMVLAKYNSLQNLDPSSGEYFKLRAWLEKLTSLPLGNYKEMPVKINDGQDACGSFMAKAQKCLGEAIYGQEEAKLQILQFIAAKISNPQAGGLSLMLTGPPGIGKTSLIKNGIAKALAWPFQFISLGGDSDASTYTGHQLVYESSHCGKIVNSLIAAKSMSMILMFDEVDKISATPKGEEVGNLLIHLTDPVQNSEFEDKYLSGVPLDLSKVMFAFSGNDMNKVDRVLQDRMVVVNLQGYNAKEKLAIAENFLLPAALKEVNLEEKVSMSKEVLQYVIETHASGETGVRELKRCIEQIMQKVNMLRMFNTKDLPFHIPEFHLPFVVKKEHIALFLKKKDGPDESIRHLYT